MALDRLKASSFQDFEILVADDASPRGDAVRAVAQVAGAEIVRLHQRSGPAAARNAAAMNAAGDILVFLDVDTSVHPDTLERFARIFRQTPELDAAIGSYDQRPTAPGVVSHFRNLLHSFVHHRSNRRATTFWAGCGAVRKDRFRSLGGFDESFPRAFCYSTGTAFSPPSLCPAFTDRIATHACQSTVRLPYKIDASVPDRRNPIGGSPRTLFGAARSGKADLSTGRFRFLVRGHEDSSSRKVLAAWMQLLEPLLRFQVGLDIGHKL
jgi:glycosyltransferase involved in cell wall biosynthesis